MADKQIDLNALGQAIDTTWGRSSTPKTNSFSVKASILSANTLRVDFHTIFNFADDREMVVVKRKLEEEAKSVTKSALVGIKKVYKDLSGSTLTSSEIQSGGNFELVGFGKPSARKTAHYKFTTTFEIG
jgi:hypothetical protein